MLRFLLFAVIMQLPPIAFAQSATQALSTCITDSTTGRDRKNLAQWTFFAIASHPEMAMFASNAVTETRDNADQQVAALFMRLITESCAGETAEAYSEGGSAAIQVAFEALGRVAMQELMSEPKVSGSMQSFIQYLDQAKINHALGVQ